MSLPWSHHIVCGAPLVKTYTFRIIETAPSRLCVVASASGYDLYFYPIDNTSRAECEAIITSLKQDLEVLS